MEKNKNSSFTIYHSQLKMIPELRFPEFKNSGEWVEKKLGEVLLKNTNRNKDLKCLNVQSVSNKYGFVNQDDYFENRRVASKDTSNYYIIKKGDFAYNPSRIDVGSLAYKFDDNDSIISPLYVSFRAKKNIIEDIFLLNWFFTENFTRQMIFEGGVRNTLNYQNLIQIKIPVPSPPEQQKIASFLSNLDELIDAHKQKLQLLKQHKKGLMQKLFPQEGEKLPEWRFPEFQNDGEWVEKKLGECLDYLQPTRYLVNNSNYSDEFETPVLTAGKSFILGYTDERNGIFREKLPVIIFDDFTTDTKYVDFPFKLKSSAIKILLSKNNSNIKFIFESMQIIKYEVGVHKRHWISTFSKLRIPVPSLSEQQKIAECLSSIDELISAQAEKIEQLEKHKKGLMQGLFPEIN